MPTTSLVLVLVLLLAYADANKTPWALKHKWGMLVPHMLNEESMCIVILDEEASSAEAEISKRFHIHKPVDNDRVCMFKCLEDVIIKDMVEGEDSASEKQKIAQSLLYIANLEGIRSFNIQYKKQMNSGNSFNNVDKSFTKEWYLDTAGSYLYSDGFGHDAVDINVLPVWDSGNTGQDSIIVVNDGGVLTTHSDIKDNYLPEYSYSYEHSDTYDEPGDPFPSAFPDNMTKSLITNMNHGTTTTALAVGNIDNKYCTTGSAPGAHWAGRYFLVDSGDDYLNSYKDFHVLWKDTEYIQVSSNSYGPTLIIEGDDGIIYGIFSKNEFQLQGLKEAFLNGNKNGDISYGTTLVFSSGNENEQNVSSNLYSSCISPYSICVGAIGYDGVAADYSNTGSSLFVTAGAGSQSDKWASKNGYGYQTVESNVEGKCGVAGAGTSFSTPIVSGLIALMQTEANNKLYARDVQTILAATSRPIDNCYLLGGYSTCVRNSWIENGAGYVHSEDYGFGLVNGEAAVAMAGKWERISDPSFVTLEEEYIFIDIDGLSPNITTNDDGLSYDYVWNIDFDMSKSFIDVDHAVVDIIWVGNSETVETVPLWHRLELTLISPLGTRSKLTKKLDANKAKADKVDSENEEYSYATFLLYSFHSVQFWHEHSYGTWKLEVRYRGCGDVHTHTCESGVMKFITADNKEHQLEINNRKCGSINDIDTSECGEQKLIGVKLFLYGSNNYIKYYYKGCNSTDDICEYLDINENETLEISWKSDPVNLEKDDVISFFIISESNDDTKGTLIKETSVKKASAQLTIPKIDPGYKISYLCAVVNWDVDRCLESPEINHADKIIPNDGNVTLFPIKSHLIENIKGFELEGTGITITKPLPGSTYLFDSNFEITWDIEDGGSDLNQGDLMFELSIFDKLTEEELLDSIVEPRIILRSAKVDFGSSVMFGATKMMVYYKNNKMYEYEFLLSGDKVWAKIDKIDVNNNNTGLVDVKTGDVINVDMTFSFGLRQVPYFLIPTFVCHDHERINEKERITETGYFDLYLAYIYGQDIKHYDIHVPANVYGTCKLVLKFRVQSNEYSYNDRYALFTDQFNAINSPIFTFEAPLAKSFMLNEPIPLKISSNSTSDCNIIITPITSNFENASDYIYIPMCPTSITFINAGTLHDHPLVVGVFEKTGFDLNPEMMRSISTYSTAFTISHDLYIEDNSLSNGTITGITISSVIIIAGITLGIVMKKKRKNDNDQELLYQDIPVESPNNVESVKNL